MRPGNARRDAALLERSVSAFRERTPAGEIRFAPEWHDLSPEQRRALFTMQFESRVLERATDPDGLSTTSRAVLNRLYMVEQR